VKEGGSGSEKLRGGRSELNTKKRRSSEVKLDRLLVGGEEGKGGKLRYLMHPNGVSG